MTINESLLKKAQEAGTRAFEAQCLAIVARDEYHNIVRRMHLAGGSLREIAGALNLSHQRVQQMVGKAGGSWWQQIWRSRNAKGNLACTFCGSSQDYVAKLIAGPEVFICDACVTRAEQCVVGPTRPEGLSLARENSKARCSFCRKRSGEGGPMVACDTARICKLCILTCRSILTDSEES